jgi:hypothetical protein
MTHNLKLGRNQWSTESFGSAMPVDTLNVVTPGSIAKRYSAAQVGGGMFRDEVLI